MNKLGLKSTSQILKAICALLILFFFLFILRPFFYALVLGAILALSLSPVIGYLNKKGLHVKKSLNLVIGVIFFILLTPSLAFLLRGSNVLSKTINDPANITKLNELINQATQFIQKASSPLGISPEEVQSYLSQVTKKLTSFTLDLFSKFISEVPNLFLFSLILILSSYFFLSHQEKIRSIFDRFFCFKKNNGDRFIEVLKSSSKGVLLSNVLTGIIQACVIAFGALFFGYSEWFLIYFITFIASFIPLLGAGPIALILSLSSFASGNNISGIGLLVISAISGASDNFIRPYLASFGTVEVPGVINFVAVIGGVITMGLPGLFLGPLIASLAFGVLPIISDELIGE